MPDHYATLGLSSGASADAVKSAYRRKANEFHPDRNAAAEAPTRFRSVQEAYETLSDAVKRKAYDDYRQRSLIDSPAEVAHEIWSTYCSGVVK